MQDSLGDRMKGYEYITRNYLPRRIPAIIRIDGKAFHTFTSKFKKPFDDVFMKAMWETARVLCSKIEVPQAFLMSMEPAFLPEYFRL